jgi:hypothetical protein
MEIVVAGRPVVALRAAPGKGDQSSMAQRGMSCCRIACSEPVVTSLGPEDFCFNHFCSRCYELLEQADNGTLSAHGAASLARAVGTLEECARRALEISLGQLALNNLDRARLLDIVLWSGDLTTELRRKLRGAALKIAGDQEHGQLVPDAVPNSRVH